MAKSVLGREIRHGKNGSGPRGRTWQKWSCDERSNVVIHGPVTRGRIWLYTVLGRKIKHGKIGPGPRNKTWQKRFWAER